MERFGVDIGRLKIRSGCRKVLLNNCTVDFGGEDYLNNHDCCLVQSKFSTKWSGQDFEKKAHHV